MTKTLPPDVAAAHAYLECFPGDAALPQRIPLSDFPFRIGRSAEAHHVVASRQVSKLHAELFRAGADIGVRDLGSCNGTFVNGQRITETVLRPGDILHLAQQEFRFNLDAGPLSELHTELLAEVQRAAPPNSLIRAVEHLRDLLTRQSVAVAFQPIISLRTREPVGYEALGRGLHDGLSSSPLELFRLAEQCHEAAALSRLMRDVAVEEAARLPGRSMLFVNLHPAELTEGDLLESLRRAPAGFLQGRRLVLEVYEDFVGDVARLRQLRAQLRDLEIGLAYDDLGSGQPRLLELAQAPPDFVKLDRRLVSGIDRSRGLQEMVQALGRLTSDLGAQMIAEGVETEAEAQTCHQLGCELGQGFVFGRPQMLREQPNTRLVDLSQLRQRLESHRAQRGSRA